MNDDPEINPFTGNDMQKIFDNIEEYYFYALIYLDRETGIRRSELMGLKWKDLNLENNNIYIQISIQEVSGKGLIF